MDARQRYLNTRAELDRFCESVGRSSSDVTLVAVSKTVGLNEVASALQGGALDFGENRPDELVKKADAFKQARWHFIGNIQSRRIKDIVGRATLIHSLFDLSHARKIDECAKRIGIVQDVLIEVNVSGEQSKSGIAPESAQEFFTACCQLQNVRVRGLMTMAAQGDLDEARHTFAKLAHLKEELLDEIPDLPAQQFDQLSMGMSEDWREAVAEGATIVRIGRAIFSETFSS